MRRKNTIENSSFKLCLEGNVTESKYFFFDTDPKKEYELAIIFGGYEKCEEDFEIKRRTYPYYVIEIPIGGKCILRIGNKTHILTKNTIAGFSPGVFHHYTADKADPMKHIFVVFTGTQAGELFEAAGFNKGGGLKIKKAGEIQYLAEAILKKGLENSIHSQQLCQSYLRALLLEQSAEFNLSNKSREYSSLNTYGRCKKYIDENFSHIMLPRQAAEKCNLNIRYMSRLFKKHAGITPESYLMRLKLNKAANLLLISNLSVKSIAAELGFADQYHFSRTFKKFHGLSPVFYRAAHL
ncbi:MAG: HTH-type transcriptional activator Btr [Planctomycetes bacterium ADurb.Bin401]|nr:MAG: HTH-type transcriptional activator Btr [Planctomycetes bacterium ADurb.Bin401]